VSARSPRAPATPAVGIQGICGASVELPSQVRQVAFTCDVARFAPARDGVAPSQVGNLRWLEQILTSAAAWSSPGVRREMVMPPRDVGELRQELGGSRALSEYLQDPEMAWARRHARFDCDSEFEPILSRLRGFDLVVGFELSPAMKRALTASGTPYISLSIHPIRFLRDLCFAVTTNAPEIVDLAKASVVQRFEIDAEVHRHRASLARRPVRTVTIPPGVPVLISQTERDSILIRDGRFVHWGEFDDQVGSALRPFDAVAVLQHPYRRDVSGFAQEIRRKFGKSVIATDANGYGVLFGRPDCPLALTLASSLGVEAALIGVPVTFLLGDPRLLPSAPDGDVATQGPVGHGILQDDFWRGVLRQRRGRSTSPARSRTGLDSSFRLGDNYLRDSLESWSYRDLASGFADHRSRKILLPGAGLSARRKAELLRGLVDSESTEGFGEDECTRRAAAQGIELQIRGAPLSPGDSLRTFGGDPWSPIQFENFHPAEDWGSWMNGSSGAIHVLASDLAVREEATLAIRASILVHPALIDACPVLRVRAGRNRTTLVSIRPSSPATRDILLIVPVVAPVCSIRLELSHTVGPEKDGVAQDARELGLALTSIEVECRPAAQMSGLRDDAVEAIVDGVCA
jgi:hypothetical protein